MAPRQKKQLVHEDNPTKGEWIRRFKANPFVFIGTIVVLIIVIVAFVVVPAIVPEASRPTVDLNFGSYNKVPISYVPGNYLANVQGNLARWYQNYLNESNAQSISQMVWRQAFEETVLHIAMLQEMKQAGYTAPEAVVDRKVAQLPQFQENGRFFAARYRQMDKISRLALWREVQELISKQHYMDDNMGLRIPSGEGIFVGEMTARVRSFGMAIFPLDSYPNEEVISYVLSEPDLFRITHLSRITINSSEREARQVLDSIKEGTKTFEEAARELSADTYADRGGEMGVRLAYELTGDVPDSQEREAVISVLPGNYSPVVKVPSGWAFFRAEEAVRPLDTQDTANIEKVRSYMRGFERGRIENWLFDQAGLLTAAAGESGFDAAVEERGLQKRDFGPLPLNYGGISMENLVVTLQSQSIPELEFAESDEKFWQLAFYTPLETPSEPLVVGDNVLVLYPREETIKDTTDIEEINTLYSTFVSRNAETSLRSHFLHSKNLEDKFAVTFLQYLYSNN
ncbi:SurA N-terminal domain-containing protein [Treponema primitia]|uniref:peptidylprolyl isomerase n=1 Tax=Treponema primitia TaxID=88058 RepID=UPI0039801DB7